MTAPAFDDHIDEQLREGIGQLRYAFSSVPQAAYEETQSKASELIDDLDRRLKLSLKVGIAVVTVMMLIFAAVMLTAFHRINAQDASLSRSQASIQQFQLQLDDANAKLVAQGLPPVDAPLNPQPGTPGVARLQVAAATANTLAVLPRETLVKPTAAELAQAVATYLQFNPPSPYTPNSQQIIDAVAAYMNAHPQAPSVRGPAGPAGRAPTAAEIGAAFRTEVNRNPQLLCPMGGSYGPKELKAANGDTLENYGCFGATSQSGGGSNGDTTTTITEVAPPTTEDQPSVTSTPDNPAPSGSGN